MLPTDEGEVWLTVNMGARNVLVMARFIYEASFCFL